LVYKNDTIPNNVPEKAHRFYEPESQEEINIFFQNYIPDTKATLYSEIEELLDMTLQLNTLTKVSN
jgi:hypothetical protein